jgi:hypothetical protein
MRGQLLVLGAISVTSAGPAAAASDWIVLRVESVEVAAVRADGSPWDDDPAEKSMCQLDGTLRSKGWEQLVSALCIRPGGKDRSKDPSEPDLVLHLTTGHTEYTSPIAQNALRHDFVYDFLVPAEAAREGLTLTINDRDQDLRAERLGAIPLSIDHLDDLLAHASRVKTFADGSVTRVEVSARRYRRGKPVATTLRGRTRAARAKTTVLAGEMIQVRSSEITSAVVVGGGTTVRHVGRCARIIARTSGGIVVLDDVELPTTEPVRFVISKGEPSVDLWRSGLGATGCGGFELPVTGRISVQAQPLGSAVVGDVGAIVRARYLNGVHRCRERTTKKKSAAVGRIHMRITVGPTGGVTKSRVRGLDDQMDACVYELSRKWRFAAPKDADGKPTSEDFDLELDLR